MEKNTSKDHSNNRRRFIKSAATGAALVSVPAKSVWGNGLANSIIASGNGSDWAQGHCLQVLSPGYWKNHTDVWTNGAFRRVFQGDPIGAGATYLQGPSDSEYFTMLDVLQHPGGGGNLKWDAGNGKKKLGGPSNVNYFLVAMYLNAKFSGTGSIYYPVAGDSLTGARGTFESAEAYARWIYSEATVDPDGVGRLLAAIIDNFHAVDDFDFDPEEIPDGAMLPPNVSQANSRCIP